MRRISHVGALRIGRRAAALVVAAAGLIAVLPQPTALIWQASVVASEWGHWLALVALGLLPGCRRSRSDLVAAVLALAGIALLLSPLVTAYGMSRTLPAELTRAFGGPSATDARARPAPLVLADLILGVRTGDVLVEEHVYRTIEGETLTLDLYRPTRTERARPVVVMMHGGGWTSGDKRDLPDLNRYLASRGTAVASIAYRLAPRWPFPAAQDDVQAAIRYVKGLAASHRLDPDRIVLMGRSAGGHMALLAAYTLRDPAIRGVVSLYGPAELRWGYHNPARPGVIDSSGTLELYLGGPPATHGPRYDAAQPSRFVGPSTPPTLFVHGLRDEHVSPFHAEFVSARLLEARVPHYVVRMPWATHGCDYVFSGPCGQITTYAVERFLGAVLSEGTAGARGAGAVAEQQPPWRAP